jgi:acyl-coenzyme A thioesterase PaaI-like protein
VATIDMRVDYLRPADPADLIAIGEVKLLGNRVGNATVQIFSVKNPAVVIAEGRAVYNIRKAGTKAPDNARVPVHGP